jgi:hypothetical protein
LRPGFAEVAYSVLLEFTLQLGSRPNTLKLELQPQAESLLTELEIIGEILDKLALSLTAQNMCRHQFYFFSNFPFAFIFWVWNHVRDKLFGLKIALK